MPVTASNLIQGPGVLYKGLFGAQEPIDASINAAPAASAWSDVGATLGGLKLLVDQEYAQLGADQIVETPERRLTKREISLQTRLAEPTLANLALAMNISAPTTGADVDTLEPSDDTTVTQPTYVALIFDGLAPGGFRRRVFGRKMLQSDKVESNQAKEDQTAFTANFVAHYVSASIRSVRWVDSKHA